MNEGKKWRWVAWSAGAGALLAGGLALAGWMFWSSPVEWPGDGESGISIPSTVDGEPYTVGSVMLCLRDVETAVVDAVTVDDGGLTVTDLAVRPQPMPPALGLGSTQQSLRSTGFGDGRTITGRCDDGAGSEIGVELTKPTAATARTDALFVHWSAGIRSGTVRVPMHLVLCEHEDSSHPDFESIR